jgi:two-component system chemotaxis response regulator CheB
MTMKALQLGAFDFILKPQSNSLKNSRAELKKSIAPMIKAFVRLRDIRRILNGKRTETREQQKGAPPIHKVYAVANTVLQRRSRIVAIGISTGGPVALAHFLSKMPANLGVPLLIAQHMPPVFTASLAKNLDRQCAITVKEAEDGETILQNTAYIAPGGKQMKVAEDIVHKTKMIRITNDPLENGCAPSADYLFRSVAEHFGDCATGVIMTGMGADGTKGLTQMKEKGAITIAQDEATSVVFGMAKKSIEAGIIDIIVPLDDMAEQIQRTLLRI